MKTKKKTAKEVAAKIQSAAVSDVIRDATPLVIGEAVMQGDVYIQRIDEGVELGKQRGSHQVAVGTTVGARHFAEGPVQVFDTASRGDQFTGPIVVADAPWMLTHPEHADFKMPAGTYQTRYQLDYATQQRVAD